MSFSWLEEVEADIGRRIAMHGLDPTEAWSEVADMATENYAELRRIDRSQ